MDPTTEIRKLKPAELYTLTRILATTDDSWKMLMAVVPKEGTENVPKFNTEHIALVEQASYRQRKSGAEIFLEEWSTMGKQRPTLKSTLDLLVRVQLFRAADYIAVDLLKTQPPERPTSGPAAQIDISDEEIAKLLKRKSCECEIFDSQSLKSLDNVLDGFSYPSQLSDQNSIEHQEHAVQDGTHRIESTFVNEISNQRIHPEVVNRNNSNLIQFSGSSVESSENNHQNPNQYNNSNLIQFSTNTIHTISSNEKSASRTQNTASDSFFNNESEFNFQQGIREPDIRIQENGFQIQNTEPNESLNIRYNDGSISNSSNCNKYELQSSELPACLADIGRDSTVIYNEAELNELPQFVVEITRKRSTPDTESFNEPSLSNDSTSSDLSSNSLTRVSLSGNNTESNIPVCVNFPSGKVGYTELISAELPQFVADLGHYKNDASLTRTVDGASDRAAQSTTDRFQYLCLDSQELPLVISECNKMRNPPEEDNLRELQSAELPQCIAELQNVIRN